MTMTLGLLHDHSIRGSRFAHPVGCVQVGMPSMSREQSTPKSLLQGAPGARWRILAHRESSSIEVENQGTVDEVVIDDWLYLEQVNEREWWLRVGDARVLIEIEQHGAARVDIARGAYGSISGTTRTE
ncbi:hypothetical protein WMF30_54250 [Sorangium sp. So ce134]